MELPPLLTKEDAATACPPPLPELLDDAFPIPVEVAPYIDAAAFGGDAAAAAGRTAPPPRGLNVCEGSPAPPAVAAGRP